MSKVNKQPTVLTLPDSMLIGVRFSAEEHQSLVQIHSVYNYSRKGWTMPRIVREACKLAAMLLSLPVPGSDHWPMPKVRDKRPWSDEELAELRERYRLAHDEKHKELIKEFKQIRAEILARRP